MKTAMLLMLMLASSGLAVDTNTFTFTNKAGQVFTDARLIKVENGQAVIIAGTVGARVKIEELPTEMVMIISHDETAEAARFRGIETKWEGNERIDMMFLEATNSVGLARVMFQRSTKNGLSRFTVGLKVWMDKYRAFEKEFALDSPGERAVEFEHSEEPRTVVNKDHYQGYEWDVFLSSDTTRDQMAALAACGRLRLSLRQQGARDSIWWLQLPTGLANFSKVCASSKAAPVQEVSTLGSSLPPIPTTKVVDVLSATMRVTESNNTWWKYAYKVDLRNNRNETALIVLKVKFLDREGFVIDEHRNYKVVVPAGQKTSISDFKLIDAKVAGNVRRITAEWEWY